MSTHPGMAPPGPASSPRAFGRVLRRVFLWLMLAGVVAALGFAAWGYWVETWPPVVRRALVTLPAPELAGKRVRLRWHRISTSATMGCRRRGWTAWSTRSWPSTPT